MVQRVEIGGLQCWADSARFLSDGWSRELAFLSMYGPRNSVRACWAKLAAGKPRQTSVLIGQDHARLSEGEKYISISTPMGRQMLHLLIIHPGATHQSTAHATKFLQVGPDPEVAYFARLNRQCPVPFRPSWRAQLWSLGREAGLIKPLPGFGVPGYVVDASVAWAALVKAQIETGGLV